jgi:lipoate-protein ligase A
VTIFSAETPPTSALELDTLGAMSGNAAWRLVVDGDLPGASNMARDGALLAEVATGSSSPALRIYGWRPPCLSLGRHQGTEAADLEFCRRHGIDVVRRPTGGRAVLHHLELTYALAAPLGRGPIPRRLQEAYRLICGALVRFCRRLGIDAELTPGEINLELPSPRSTVPCFEAPAGGEVVVEGRKLIGSAMRSHQSAMIQHGAILLDWDSELQAGAMGLSDDRSLRPLITTISEELGRLPERSALEDALAEAFRDELEVTLEPARLTRTEGTRAATEIARYRVSS